MKKYYPLVLLVLLFNACSDFKGNEDSVVSSLAPPVCDNSTPSISEVSAIGTTTDTTPDYVFSSTHSGAITFSGSCSSSNTSANVGQNTITLNELNTGTYTNCRLQVTDSCLGLTSNNLRLSNFTISEPCDDSDNTSPILSESVRIGLSTDNNTNDTTPDYIFASNESGTITFGGSCMSNTSSASIGNNTIQLRPSRNSGFSHGMYNDCSLRVTDCNGNISDNLTISPFNVYVREKLYSVTYGNGHFVAVGSNGRILTSPNADNGTWTTQTSGTTQDLYDVGTDNSTFVAVGNGGELIRSVDNGTTWTKPDTWGKREDGTNITLLGVAGQIDNISGNNDFQIITNSSSGKTGISSDNGSTWGVGQQFAARDIVYGDDLYVGSEWFVAVGANGGIRKTKDNGVEWTLTNSVANDLYGITFGYGSTIITTTGLATDNGTTFYDNITIGKTGVATVGTISDQDNHSDGIYNDISLFSLTGSGSGAKARIEISSNSVSSIDIIDVGNNYTIGDNLSVDNSSICCAISFLVATTTSDNLTEGTYNDVDIISSSGSGAVATVIVENDNISSITITSRGSNFSVGDVITIDNSSTNNNFPGSIQLWVKTLYSYDHFWGIFLAVGDNGDVALSTDNLSSWTSPLDTKTTTLLDSVAYGNGKFIAVGYENMNSRSSPGGVVILSSDNGSSWSKTSENYVFSAITYGNSKFVAVQEWQYHSGWKYERIYTSTDGVTWTLVHDPNY